MKREFDGKLWKAGNSLVVTIPSATIERYGLKEASFLTVVMVSELKKGKTQMKREFDGKLWKAGNSLVVTIPSATIERYGLKEASFLTLSITDRNISGGQENKDDN